MKPYGRVHGDVLRSANGIAFLNSFYLEGSNVRFSLKSVLHNPLIAALFSILTLPVQAQELQPLRGQDNPVLAFNLNGVADWSPQIPFLNVARTMRPFFGHVRAGKWGGMNHEELAAKGVIDDDGWLIRIPQGVAEVGTIWAWSEIPGPATSRKGRYVMTYKGQGRIKMDNVRVISQAPGRIVFENPNGANQGFRIQETDPQRTGNYIRDIVVVHERNLDLYEAGARFNPAWLNLIRDSRQIRFMNWQKTNNSELVWWEDGPKLTDATWTAKGVPVEIMVQLANEIGIDPWFTMPHKANDRFFRAFAQYVRDHLDPRLKAHVEYSNEAWNWAFRAPHYMRDESERIWGVKAHNDFYAKRATEMALIWDEVFGSEAEDRLVKVVGAQTGWIGPAERILAPDVWVKNEPNAYVPANEVFDALAVTTYFGGSIVRDEDQRAAFLNATRRPGVKINDYLYERISDAKSAASIQNTVEFLRQHKELADAYGLDMIAYEGGQHVHHSFAVQGLGKQEIEKLTAILSSFVRSPEMGRLYDRLWDEWAKIGDGPFMQFTDVGRAGRAGSWGMYAFLGDSSPRSKLVVDRAASSTPWWDAEAGPQYQDGVTEYADASGGILNGTEEEDYLIGASGDDLLFGGPGDDGLHGGPGTDVVVLSGGPGDYRISARDYGHLIKGPDGADRVVAVEGFRFGDGSEMSLQEMLAARP